MTYEILLTACFNLLRGQIYLSLVSKIKPEALLACVYVCQTSIYLSTATTWKSGVHGASHPLYTQCMMHTYCTIAILHTYARLLIHSTRNIFGCTLTIYHMHTFYSQDSDVCIALTFTYIYKGYYLCADCMVLIYGYGIERLGYNLVLVISYNIWLHKDSAAI